MISGAHAGQVFRHAPPPVVSTNRCRRLVRRYVKVTVCAVAQLVNWQATFTKPAFAGFQACFSRLRTRRAEGFSPTANDFDVALRLGRRLLVPSQAL